MIEGNSGIKSAASSRDVICEIVAELKDGLGDGPFQHILAFFSGVADVEPLTAAIQDAFPGIAISGCSTAGQITLSGMANAGVLLVAFPKSGFKIHAGLVEEASRFGVERATDLARRLKNKIGAGMDQKVQAFAVLLVDGLSNVEEQIVAAVHWATEDIPLVGGSAGDSLSFDRTAIIYDGRVYDDAAVLLLIETDRPFRVFKTQNFEPTPIKLVVTAADAENRIVHELNAEPAAREYATAIGLLPDDLGPFSFASYPLVVRVGDDYYCRSIRNMNADGSLSFFCAIDEGLVFTVARPNDMLKATAGTLDDIARDIGPVDLVLGFDCVLRRLDAENRQVRHQMEELYKHHRIVGFHTYGEQFNAMHLNQTLTGIAFGTQPRPPA